jgi:hypothetical protein
LRLSYDFPLVENIYCGRNQCIEYFFTLSSCFFLSEFLLGLVEISTMFIAENKTKVRARYANVYGVACNTLQFSCLVEHRHA